MRSRPGPPNRDRAVPGRTRRCRRPVGGRRPGRQTTWRCSRRRRPRQRAPPVACRQPAWPPEPRPRRHPYRPWRRHRRRRRRPYRGVATTATRAVSWRLVSRHAAAAGPALWSVRASSGVPWKASASRAESSGISTNVRIVPAANAMPTPSKGSSQMAPGRTHGSPSVRVVSLRPIPYGRRRFVRHCWSAVPGCQPRESRVPPRCRPVHSSPVPARRRCPEPAPTIAAYDDRQDC